MDKSFLIVANWKANLDVGQSLQWLTAYSKQQNKNSHNIKIVLCPSYLAIFPLKQKLLTVSGKLNTVLGSQDISPFDNGPFTGEATAKMLSGYVDYSLVGHSERRKNFSETTAMVAKKMEQAIKYGIIPIICAQDLSEIPANIKQYEAAKLTIMFEPAAAISQAGQYRAEAVQVISSTIREWRGRLGFDCQFLYGGSVNPDNVKSLLASGVNGFVVGNASLKVESFAKIIKTSADFIS